MKLFYSTEEVAGHFDIAPSKVRYYVSEFGLKIKSSANKKTFTHKDMDDIGEIIYLLDEEKYTLEGAKAKFSSKSSTKRQNEELLKKLKGIKEILTKIKGGNEE